MAVCLIITLVLGFGATRLKLNASFEKTIPTKFPYIANYLRHKADLSGFGNAVRITVEAKNGTIYDKDYLETLRKINDDVFLMPGVDRAYMKSLWTPSTQWRGVTEEGFESGPVIPDTYDGSPAMIEQIRANVERSGEVGQIVAQNGRSSVVFIPLLSTDVATGKPLDYGDLSRQLEAIRTKYSSAQVAIHITGFAKVLGDLIDGLHSFLLFFAMAILISGSFLLYYIRCWRATSVVVVCSLVAVVWQLGLLALMGFVLDPYSILVPFLIFAIGMSHGSQKMNGILQDVGRGTIKVVAARYTFRRLFLAGLTALLADAVGFAVLAIIQIQVIQELALTASIGVAILIVTNLILVPILLSYVGVSAKAAERSLHTELAEKSGGKKNPMWQLLDLFTQKEVGDSGDCGGCCAGRAGTGRAAQSSGRRSRSRRAGTAARIGIQPGQCLPECQLRRQQRRAGGHGGDAGSARAVASDTLERVDALEWQLRQLTGVESTNSLALLNREIFTSYNEGSMLWYDLPRNQDMIDTITANAPRGVYNDPCNLLTLSVFLKDHKAETLTRVVNAVEAFAAKNNTPDAKFLLGAGTSGIDAATNIVVKKAMHEMLFWIYGAVILLCFITFRSWRAVVVAVLPLMLTSVLCEALMAKLGMGVKVATLPVVALGVGIGVDYALYMLSVTLNHLRHGRSLSEAYYRTLCFTGRVVLFTGFTLAVAVITWSFSPIKFQADMGILLAFMFIWNMLGAMILLPALAYYILPRPKPSAAEPAAG